MVNFLRSLWARYFGHFRVEEVQLVEGDEDQEWRLLGSFVGMKLAGPCTIYKVYYCDDRFMTVGPYWRHIGTTNSETRARAIIYAFQEWLKRPSESKPRVRYY